MITDSWRYIIRAYHPVSMGGGGLAWAEGFGSGGERDAKLLAAAMQMRAGEISMVSVQSNVNPWRRRQSLRSPEQVQAWVQKIGQALR